MNTIGSTTHHKPLSQQGQDMADNAADSAQGAIRSTQRAADSALDRLSDKVDEVRSQATPILNKVTSQAEAAARRGMEAVRDTSQQLRDKAKQASDMTVAYVKDEPIKAMLIAAATGALLMGLISLHGAARDERSTGRASAAMIHPLLRLAATEPHLLGDHVEAYAALVGEEVSKVSTVVDDRASASTWSRLCMVGVGLVLVGVALLLCAALPSSDYPAPWAMIVDPLAPFVDRTRLRARRALEPIDKAFDARQAASSTPTWRCCAR